MPLADTHFRNSRREGCMDLFQVGDGRRSRPRRHQCRPLFGAERNGGRQERRHAALAGFRNDRGARVTPHQLEIHQMVIAEEQRADRAVRDDAGQRLQHLRRRRRERDRLDQQQAGVDRLGAEELRQNAEQHVVLAGDIDRVARRIGLVPIGAELRLPLGQHRHPVRDLRLRRPCHVLCQIRRLLLAESFERGEGNDALGDAFIHEGDVVLQDGAVVVAPARFHRGRVEAIERRLHAAAIGQHRAAPGFVVGIVDIGADDLRQRHRAVADRLQQLIDHRHLRRVQRRLPGPVQDHPSAGTREQAEDHRMLVQDVLLEDLCCIAIELEHAGVERQHIPGRDIRGRCRGLARDRRHVGRKGLRIGDW